MPTSKEAALSIIGDIFAKASVVADLAHAMEAEAPQPPKTPAVAAAAPPQPEPPTVPPPTAQPASQKDVLAALRGIRPANPK